MIVNKAYKYRVFPTKDQQHWFAKCFGCARFIYNKMLDAKITDYKENKDKEDYKPMKLLVSNFKKEYPFLAEMSQDMLGYELQHLNRAFNNFYKNPRKFGFPKFKSKWDSPSFSDKGRSLTIAEDNKYLFIPKMRKEPLKVIMHRPLEGRPVTFTISKTATGEYYIAIQCEIEVIDYALPKTQQSIGVDLGVRDFLVLSNGTKVANPQYLRASLEELAKEQRILSLRGLRAKKEGRKLSEGKNYQKQRKKVAKIHQKVARQREYFIHNHTAELVANYDVIATENLKPSTMINSPDVPSRSVGKKVNRAIHDASWGTFLTVLQYKADWNGRTVVTIDGDFPSSQICSCCGVRDDSKPVKVRKWTCPNCGAKLDRDINASINILAEGLRILKEQGE